MTPELPRSITLFCRVIDNYGDAGVCWRLCRQLAREHGIAANLVIDRLDVLKKLVPAIDPALNRQEFDGVSLLAWREEGVEDDDPELVIEAFACTIPEAYQRAMSKRRPAPLWINLEYLSAEPWAETQHLMGSVHPQLGLAKTFFFPGFSARSGGLIRERGVTVPEFAAADRQFGRPLKVFLFAYDRAPREPLFAAMRNHGRQVRVCEVLREGAGDATQAWRNSREGVFTEAPGFQIIGQDFVAQSSFDAVLADQDLLFVRGEDSLVRAIWSGKPFIWQLYPQAGDAHLPKLEAFLECYCERLDPGAAGALRGLMRAWNRTGEQDFLPLWREFLIQFSRIERHAHDWARRQAQLPDLASNLLSFFRKNARI
ncbi:MAG TPA: elongation factor P maturation arginine rhamnosyltransferase EarP [Usitatibacteraceae bacterium]|nr:elongation factor P maturation arginine rhamnosyltransferase EarP [Usitatibacteraceae bacterium]